MSIKLTHLDAQGHARMVDVGEKPITAREAIAEGSIALLPATIEAITSGTVPKGEVLSTARLAGIMAAKKCSELIPLCHSLALDSVTIDFDLPAEISRGSIGIRATARCHGKTGVEMEALTAVSVAGLTIYDMCKAIDQSMAVEHIRLVQKTGGTKKSVEESRSNQTK